MSSLDAKKSTGSHSYVSLANGLSLFRIAVTPVVMVLFASGWYYLCALVFAIASLTDGFDGYFARRNHDVTVLGSLLDFTADKILVSAVLIMMVENRLLPSWLVVTLIGREFVVMSIRIYAVSKGSFIASNSLGRAKTLALTVGIIFVLLGQHFKTFNALDIQNSILAYLDFAFPIGIAALAIASIFAMISCVQYLALMATDNTGGRAR